jgi:hypothetical protein
MYPEELMTIEFDDNGKFFTDIISKTPIPVIIQTVSHRIHGNIHVSKDCRLKDELDLMEKFIAITDAVIYTPEGHVLYQAAFLAVQRTEIIWVIPDCDIIEPSKGNPG